MPKTRILTVIDRLTEQFKDNQETVTLLEELHSLSMKQDMIASDDKERFRAVVDNVIDGIITIDHKGIVQSYNTAAENLFGYKAKEVIGKNVKMLMPNPYHDEHDEYLSNYMHSGIPKIIGIGRQVTGLRKDGSTFPMDLAVSQINLGNEVMFAGILRDITEENRKKEELKQSQNRLQSILDNVYEGVITINAKGKIDSFNLAAEKIFGYEPSEVIGHNVKMLMPEPYHSEHDGYLNNYMQGGKAKVIGIGREVEGRRKDGSTFPLYLAVTGIESHDGSLFVGMVRDLTEEKRLANMKSEFVSTVSHELRTPLTSIRGSLSLIKSGTMGEVGEKITPLLNIALNNSERLILLINDILDMEKIESGKMNFELDNFDLNDLINKSLEGIDGYAKEHEVSLHFEKCSKPVKIYVDSNRMQQVLTNLLSNAIKFSPKHDTVDINVIRNGQKVRVEVHDNGPGIPEEFKKHIFQKFAQADSSDTKQKGGTGLGLNISKSIIERFGGNIGFLCPAEKGTTFFFEIPIIQELVQPIDKKIVKKMERKVLIVEDDHDIATLLQLILRQEGIPSDIAYSASEAKILLQQNHYDAMTLDIMLPDQDGISLLNDIRHEKSLKDLAVVVVSAKAISTKSQNINIALEVVDWVNKPIDQAQLLTSLNKAIKMNENDKPHILHVEDDSDIANLVSILLKDLGQVDLAINKSQAQNILEKQYYDLIILDMMLPDGSAEELLPYIKKHYPETQVVLFSALEVDNRLKDQVTKALVKSRTSNTMLVDTIKSILKNKT